MSLSNYTFREAGERDFQEIEELFVRRGVKRGWTTWKYLKSPDGLARVFVAEDPGKTIVGTLAHLPRRFTSAGTGTLIVMQVVDVFVSEKLRTQGVFLGLLEFARKHIDGCRIGLPNDSSDVFGLGLGWHALAPYETWQFPVLIGETFAGSKAEFIAPLANAIFNIYKFCWLPGRTRNLEMKRATRFCRDYSVDPALIHGVRSADYLNWRFVDNPVSTYCAYEFFEGDESVGYCVLTLAGSSAIIFDFVTVRYRRSCLRLLVDHCRENGIALISFSGTGLKLRRLGFIRRRSNRNCNAIELPEGHWIITSCDLDFEHEHARQDIR